MSTVKERIIQTLRSMPNITDNVIDMALSHQTKTGLGLGKILIERDILDGQSWLELLVTEIEMPSIRLSQFKEDKSMHKILPEKLMRQYDVFPISQLGDLLSVALSDPLNVHFIDDLRHITGKQIIVVLALPNEIHEKLNSIFGTKNEQEMSTLSQNIDVGDFEILIGEDQFGELDEGEASQAPVIRIVNLVIREALNKRASDIHMEPTETSMRVRYRIDGVLRDVLEIPKDKQNAVLVRLKIMAKMDITVNQIPQDGRFKMRFGRDEVDFRVSMLPTTHGQKIVMRVLDKKNLSIGLSKSGFSERSIQLLEEAILKPFGMILVTGPTGSGKSTTLYSIINKLNTVDKNIITVEEPVEYLVDGLTQIDVKPDIGLTFAAGLKAILRQSPDIVMVGEIRDGETADIAIKASLTGQLVFSTLHTNDATGSLTRLVDMGVEPFLVSSSVLLICAQRLCRRICPKCKVEIEKSSALYDRFKDEVPSDVVLYDAKGCDHCNHTGYAGRFGVTEILVVTDEVREMLLRGCSSDEIQHYAKEHQGMKLLWDDALDRLIAGDTTPAEVLRIASDEV